MYAVYYLGHSAWAVETRACLLVFDPAGVPSASGQGLANCAIDLAAHNNKNIVIFYSHRHGDHYNEALHRASQDLANVFTVLGGFASPLTKRTLTLQPGASGAIGGINVYAADSTDQGVCFLAEPEAEGGPVIFHAGDNADWGDGDPANKRYVPAIDYIAGLDKKICAAFIPVCTSGGTRPSAMTKGALYAIKELNPAAVFPMHANGREELYEGFAKDFSKAGVASSALYCAKRPGDRFDIGE